MGEDALGIPENKTWKVNTEIFDLLRVFGARDVFGPPCDLSLESRALILLAFIKKIRRQCG